MTNQPSPTSENQTWPVSPRNRVKRLHDRAFYDRDTIHAILDAGILAHVAWVIEGQPFCTPTLYWRDGDTLFWHGSSASRMLRNLAQGVQACLTVSHLDGLVLARTGFNHSANYRSAMCFGTARLIKGAEKTAALAAMIDRIYPGRDAILRPATVQEIKATAVIAMPIDEASAKIRAKGNVDNATDLENPAWAGVIPVETVLRAHASCPHNPAVPDATGLSHLVPGARLDTAITAAMRDWQAGRY